MTFDDLSSAIFASKSLQRFITREKEKGIKISHEVITPVLLEQLSFSLYEIKNALVELSTLVKKNRFSKLPHRWSMNLAEEGTLLYQQEKGSQAFHFTLEINPAYGIVSVITIEDKTLSLLLKENGISKEAFDHNHFLKEVTKELVRQLELSESIRVVVLTPYGPVENKAGKPSVKVNYWGTVMPHFTMS